MNRRVAFSMTIDPDGNAIFATGFPGTGASFARAKG